MGGNALAHLGATRVTKEEYLDYLGYLENTLPTGFREIPYVREKSSFGDMDIIISTGDMTVEDMRNLLDNFLKLPYTVNGNVLSFLLDGKLQVDSIFMNRHVVDFAVDYFSYNDLGNFIGRIAHKMGMKFGHDGLWIPVRDGTHKAGEILLTRNFDDALEFMKYNPARFREGFDTFEDMFRYAAQNEYFSPSIYALENRNHTARVRDRKRPSYMRFLEWIDAQSGLNDFDWGHKPKSAWLETIFARFPEAGVEFRSIMTKLENVKRSKEKFPSEEMMNLTGLSGKEFGSFKRFLVDNLPAEYEDYHEWVNSSPVDSMRSYVLRTFDMFTSEKRRKAHGAGV